MRNYIIKRLLLIPLTLLGILALNFVIVQFAPIDKVAGIRSKSSQRR